MLPVVLWYLFSFGTIWSLFYFRVVEFVTVLKVFEDLEVRFEPRPLWWIVVEFRQRFVGSFGEPGCGQ